MHTLLPLPYAYNALEPFIDEKTMTIHHRKHQQIYTDKLNATLEKHPELFKKPVEDLLKNLSTVPEDIRTAVKNHGGGYLNHTFSGTSWRRTQAGSQTASSLKQSMQHSVLLKSSKKNSRL